MSEKQGYEHPFIAETYDFVVPYQNRKDVGFFIEMAQEAEGRVLEIGCGTGRILIPTARKGMAITGLDLSAAMLDVCQKKLDNEAVDVRERVRLQQGDMRDFQLKQTFPLITVPFRTFHHLLTVDDQASCLRCIFRHLEENGRVVLDLFNPSLPYLYDERFLKLTEKEPAFTLPDGRCVTRKSRLLSSDLFHQVLDMEFVYKWNDPAGQKQTLTHRFQMRYLFRYEVEHLLGVCGLRLESVYADYKKSPFGSQYPGELIVVARKRQEHSEREFHPTPTVS